MPGSLLLKNVRPMGQPTTDVLIQDGLITRVEVGLEAPDPSIEIINGQNNLLLPGLVDGHAHIDKTLWGLPWHKNQAPPGLTGLVENERRVLAQLGISPEVQSTRIARQCISQGTTHIRTHVDLDTERGLPNFEGVMATREALKDYLDIQIVAFPQSGLLIRPGTLELVEAAVKNGAEVVGGLDPSAMDRDPVRHLDAIFALADRYGVELDIHLHEPGDLGAFSVELIAERTRVLGLKGRVAISHVFCLGDVNDAYFRKLVDLLLENDIAIMTLTSGTRPFPPILRLHEAGVRLFTGNDGIRDTWSPYGTGDMLERAWILSYRSGFRRDEQVEVALHMATFGGAQVVGAKNYGVEVGCQADLVVVAGETLTEAVMSRPPRILALKRGRIIARNGECVV